jgi:uncharacterized membrane protein YphA (DoxX/SURF4 family)
MKTTKLLPALDLGARLYLAYILIEYGVSKFTGTMFNNASAQVLNTSLKDIDLFHLTWYTFKQHKALSYFVGSMQVLSALMLVFNRTVLLGCLIAFPIFINILIIDFSCLPTPYLGIRVIFYLLLLLGFCYYRKEQVQLISRSMLSTGKSFSDTNTVSKIAFTALSIVIVIVLEVVFTRLLAMLI